MTLRKFTIDKIVKYNPLSGKTEGRYMKSKRKKTSSLPRERNKNYSQNNKKIP